MSKMEARDLEQDRLTMPKLAQIESKMAEICQKKNAGLHATISNLKHKKEMNASKMQLFKVCEDERVEGLRNKLAQTQ